VIDPIAHLRQGLRLVRRSPVFTATAVLSLAVGLGANTAIFTVANAMLFAPTPGLADATGLVDIGRTTDGRGFDTVSFATFTDLAERKDVFSGVAAVRFEPEAMSLGSADGADRIFTGQVSASYFDVLGLSPAAGAFFHAGEERIGDPLRKVVLSHAFWRSRYGADRTIVGREITLNGDAFVVAGVAPEGFHGTTILSPDLWVPLTAHARATPSASLLRSRESVWLTMIGRLRPEVTQAQAQQAIDAMVVQLRTQFPDIYRPRFGLAAVPLSRLPAVGEYAIPFIGILMALVGLVLVVVCTNLGGLLLARAAARSREIAVRLALGASRGSLVWMLVVETLLLFVAGAAASVMVARWIVAMLVSSLPALPVPIAFDLPIDWRVLAFTLTVALVTGLATGAAPAWHSVRAPLSPDLKGDAASPRRQRLRHAFLSAQLAFCVVLIVLAGLFFRALSTAASIDTGMRVSGVDLAGVDLSLGGYEGPAAVEAERTLRERLAHVPGVIAVGQVRMVPLSGGGLGLGELRKRGDTGPQSNIETDWNVVSPGYFGVVGMPILRGRDFDPTDRSDRPFVAVVNEHLATRLWPGEDPIGKVVETGEFGHGAGAVEHTITIVGVVRDAKYRWVGETVSECFFVPYAQFPMHDLRFLLRRDDGLAATASIEPAVRAVVRDFDRNLPLVHFGTLQDFADVGLLPQRVAAAVAGWLGTLALVLAAIGIYGVTAYAVASRTREIGVRVALGADPGRIVRLVLSLGLRLTAIGAALGLAAAAGAALLVRSLLFGVGALDPLAYGLPLVVLAIVSIGAAIVPARRAARVDPVRALRAD